MGNSKNLEAATLETNNGNKKLKKEYTHTIFRDWCKRCGICVAFCPKKVFVRNEDGMPEISNPTACIGCRFCELHCPDFAISIKQNGSRGVA
jgi:2-oxoglutarate ferredoxin oxidoreductase subunit delta